MVGADGYVHCEFCDGTRFRHHCTHPNCHWIRCADPQCWALWDQRTWLRNRERKVADG